MKNSQEKVLKAVNRLDWAFAGIAAIAAVFFAAGGHNDYAYAAAGCSIVSAAMGFVQPARWAKKIIEKKFLRKAKEA